MSMSTPTPLARDLDHLSRTWFLACQALNTTLITTLLFQDDTEPSTLPTNASFLLRLTFPASRVCACFDQCIPLYERDSPPQQDALLRAHEARRVFGGSDDPPEVYMTGLQIALMSTCIANDPVLRRVWRDPEPYANRFKRREELKQGKREAVAEIIVATPPNLIDYPWGCNSTSLHLASFFGETSLCVALISRGADVNRVNDRGFTPLDCALATGHTETHSILKMFDTSKSVPKPVVMKPSMSMPTATKRGLDAKEHENPDATDKKGEEERDYQRQCRQKLMGTCICSGKNTMLTEDSAEVVEMDVDTSEPQAVRSGSISTTCSYSSTASDESATSFTPEHRAFGESIPQDDEDNVSPFDRLFIGTIHPQTSIPSRINAPTKPSSVPTQTGVVPTVERASISSSPLSSCGSLPATPPNEQGQDTVQIVGQAVARVICGQKEDTDERIGDGNEGTRVVES
ncbi:hypothetical protein BC938DRAFT_483130 [Jimgerdemannia flammicorona]|uniref:Uncharacterized protein n=1 Tax=Jimgerdemannia flammicorona TaxID=994334 RepID=A0A433QVV2_9FUNG|nr:hypothetical protein BC938DRAFT_483130 [Jimgerdemannia flammicorona]